MCGAIRLFRANDSPMILLKKGGYVSNIHVVPPTTERILKSYVDAYTGKLTGRAQRG